MMPHAHHNPKQISRAKKASEMVTREPFMHMDIANSMRKIKLMMNRHAMPPTQKLSVMPSPTSLVIRMLSGSYSAVWIC